MVMLRMCDSVFPVIIISCLLRSLKIKRGGYLERTLDVM